MNNHLWLISSLLVSLKVITLNGFDSLYEVEDPGSSQTLVLEIILCQALKANFLDDKF